MAQDKNGYYRPLPKSLTIKESPIQGLGLFAVEDIKAGENLGCTHVWFEADQELIRTPLGGFYNHNAVDPNCTSEQRDGKSFLITLRDIKAGEELTTTYTLYDPSGKDIMS